MASLGCAAGFPLYRDKNHIVTANGISVNATTTTHSTRRLIIVQSKFRNNTKKLSEIFY